MEEKKEFTHFDQAGNAWMVDVGAKADTEREAYATGKIFLSAECYAKVKAGTMKKGDVLSVARIGGIMGAKHTCDLIPLCHNINLTKLEVNFQLDDEQHAIIAFCRAKTVGKTGVEMEALTGVNVALLTVYDMCKAVDKSMEMGEIYLLKKSGGKSGTFIHPKNQEAEAE